MAQEVGSEDGVLPIRNYEGPSEGSTRPRFGQRGCTPLVAMGDWLAACREGPVKGEVQRV